MFKCFKSVRVSRDENVHIQLPLQQCQAGHIAPGNNLMAVNQPDSELPDSYYFLFRIIQALRRRKAQPIYQPNTAHLRNAGSYFPRHERAFPYLSAQGLFQHAGPLDACTTPQQEQLQSKERGICTEIRSLKATQQ